MKRSSWARIGLVCGSVLVALAVTEVAAGYLYPYFQPWTIPAGLRDRTFCEVMVAFDAHTGWWPKPNQNCVMPAERSVLLRTNSAGFRADHEFGEKAPGVLRIGAFGDSFTFGALVTADETYGSLLEQRVPNVEVVNFGLAGGGPDQSLLALRHKAAGMKLDAVIVAPSVENIERILMPERDGRLKPYFTLTDGRLQLHNYPVPFRAAPAPRTGRAARRGIGTPLLDDSALWQLALAGVRPVALRLGLYKPYSAHYDGAAGELLGQILRAFRDEAGGARLIFAPLPTYHYIEYGLPPDYEAVFRRAAEAVNGTYIDVLPGFLRLTPDERRATRFQFDQHYTPMAYRVVADALLPHVMELRP
jgi:hypothetical protein